MRIRDMVRVVGVLCWMLCGCVGMVEAQTLAIALDKHQINEVDAYDWPAELDGDVTTREWLGMRYREADQVIEYRAILFRSGRLCKGVWFNPWASLPPLVELTVGGLMPAGDRQIFVAQGPQFYFEIRIDLPLC